jgi:hypothetical protein
LDSGGKNIKTLLHVYPIHTIVSWIDSSVSSVQGMVSNHEVQDAFAVCQALLVAGAAQ